MQPSSSTTATSFSFSIWPSEPRLNTDADTGGATGGGTTERRERISRWRAKRDTAQQWEAEHVRNVRPLRLRPPSQQQQQPLAGNGEAQQTPLDATEPEARLAPHHFDPYGWAALLWLGGLALDHNAYHLMPYFWAVVALAGIVFKHGPHYLFTSGVVVAIGYFLFQTYSSP